MSYQLKIDEIMEGLNNSEHPHAQEWQRKLEALANEMAEVLAAHLGIVAGIGDFQGLDFAGLCVPFRPAFEGQEVPDAIADLDDASEWEFVAD